MEDVLKSRYYKSALGYDIIDWFVDEVIKMENKMAFYSENVKKDIIMTEEGEEDYRNKKSCRFCEKNVESDKVRDHCHLTGKHREPAHSKCKSNITQKKVILYHLYLIISGITFRICSSKNWLIKRMIK